MAFIRKDNQNQNQTNNLFIKSILPIFLIIILFLDYYIGTSLDVLSDIVKSSFGLTIFSIFVLVSIGGSYMMLRYVLNISNSRQGIFPKRYSIFKIIQIVIYLLAGYLLTSILINGTYHVLTLNVIVTLSYGLSIIINLFASLKLFSLFRENKDKFILLFGISFLMLFINNTDSLLLFNVVLSEKPSTFNMLSKNVFEFGCDSPTTYCFFKENIISFQTYTVLIYFVLFWICSIYLLHHHIYKIGKMKFFILTSLPLILYYFEFVYQYNDLYTISNTLKFSDNTIFAIQIFLVTFFNTLTGILFGISFKSVSNLLKISNMISQFLNITSFAIIFFFISANATVAAAGMPPFGIANIIFLPFSSLLLYIGIFNSIRSISNDINVKKYIKNSAYRELKIMGNLAESSNIDEMKTKVFRMSKKYAEELQDKSNVGITSSEDELKDYLDDAIKLYKEKKIDTSS